MHLRVTDYSRVSTDHLEQQKSLKNQIDYFDEMIKNNKNWVYVNGYIDDGISGTRADKRDNFMKMIEDARNGKFDLIITKEISRFSRNTLDSIKYTRELLSFGVAVLFVNDNINTALPDSELRLTIMASMAQDEIRRLSERVKFGMNRAIKNGNILGNDMLYGYKKNKLTGNLTIVPTEAKVVQRLFSLYAMENYSITKIGKIFNDEGIRTCQNKKWYVSTLIRMIRNPKYKGYYCGKKTEIIDYMTKKVKMIPKRDWILYEDNQKIPPIIDKYLWERANKKLNMKKQVYISTPFKNKYPLSMKIFCSEHNEVFHRRKQCKASDDITWICAKYLTDGKKACNSPNIRESEIYTIFSDIIALFKIELSCVVDILLEIYNKKKNDNNIIENLKIQRQRILIKKDKLLELNIDGILSNNEFKIKNTKYNKELASINQNIVNSTNFKDDNNLNEIIKQYIEKEDINIKLLKLLLNKIFVSKIDNNNKNIELKIFLNISKEFLKDEFKQSIIERDYEFKRGYNTKCTKRYKLNYKVKIYF